MKIELTDYGFHWGDAEIVRLFENNGDRYLEIRTPKRRFHVRITKGGRLKVGLDRNPGCVSPDIWIR